MNTLIEIQYVIMEYNLHEAVFVSLLAGIWIYLYVVLRLHQDENYLLIRANRFKMLFEKEG